MRTPAIGPSVLALTVLITLAAVAPLATASGPLPSVGSVGSGTSTAVENTGTSADVLGSYAASSSGHAQRAAEQVLAGLPSELVVPAAELNAIIEEAAHFDGSGQPQGAIPETIDLTRASVVAVIEGASVDMGDWLGFPTFVADTGLRALGVEVGFTPLIGTVPFPTATFTGGACTSDPQAAIDAARPGDEVLVCPGAYGPLTVDVHFLTLRAAQGPAATVIGSNGGDGISVQAAGVTVEGFQVRGATDPGAAAIRVGASPITVEDRTRGQLFATLVRGNVLLDNHHGIVVADATAAWIGANTVRGSAGAAILVTDGEATTTESVGVVVAVNDLIHNDELAIENRALAPVLAIANHYGEATGPRLRTPAGCVGASTPTGTPTCENGLGPGVVPVGFSPVRVAS